MPGIHSVNFVSQLLPLLALGLDAILGDPPCRWHPARLAGALCTRLEPWARGRIPDEKKAGMIAALCAVLAFALPGGLLVLLLQRLSGPVGYLAAVFLIYTTIALKDLKKHSDEILRALEADNLPLARERTAKIVGRETDKLDEAQIVRATLESTGESSCDGVAAPLFYAALGAVLGGAPLAAAFALAYRTANTLDSTWGFRNERYEYFGWAAARLDDLLNYLPARMNAYTLVFSAALAGLDWWRALTIVRRDSERHDSPNSGFGEAAFAGALGVRLGGLNTYNGMECPTPYIGDEVQPLHRAQIRAANRLLTLSTLLFTAILFVLAGLLRGN